MLRAVQRKFQLPLRSAFAPAISTQQQAGTMTTDTPQQQDEQQQTSPFYSLSAKTIKDTELPFSELKGKVVLLVNTASKCGFTPQVRWARSVIPATFQELFASISYASIIAKCSHLHLLLRRSAPWCGEGGVAPGGPVLKRTCALLLLRGCSTKACSSCMTSTRTRASSFWASPAINVRVLHMKPALPRCCSGQGGDVDCFRE